MEKYIYDENNGLWYELQGNYYIPCLKLPERETKEIGVWGCSIWTISNNTAEEPLLTCKWNAN